MREQPGDQHYWEFATWRRTRLRETERLREINMLTSKLQGKQAHALLKQSIWYQDKPIELTDISQVFSVNIKGKFFNGDDPLLKSALLPRSQFIGFSVTSLVAQIHTVFCSPLFFFFFFSTNSKSQTHLSLKLSYGLRIGLNLSSVG